MTPITLRLATLADAPAVAALHTESWRFAYRGAYSDEYLDGPVFEDRARVWRQRLSSPPENQHVILAEDGDALVGFICAYGADDERYGTLVDNLHVRPALHRRGIGRHLLAEVAAWNLVEHPGVGVYLWVLEQNARAQAFYQHLGANDVGSKTTVPPGGGSTVARRYAWSPQQLPVLAETLPE
jgi:ribosomal protein S18 acetylase RimI-like enzyme